MKTSDKLLLTLFAVGGIFYIIAFYFMLNPKQSTVADYDLGNCSFINNPDKIMVCFDFNQDGKSLGAYAGSTLPIILLRTTESKTVRHEALHHLLFRDTKLTDDQQHKFIEDLEIIEREIFKLHYQ